MCKRSQNEADSERRADSEREKERVFVWKRGVRERGARHKVMVSLGSSYDWSKVHLWTLQSHEPINLPFLLNLVKCRFLRCITRWIRTNSLPQEHRVWGWGTGVVPLGTCNAWSRWLGHYRKECTDPHLLTLLTFHDFCAVSPLVTKFPKQSCCWNIPH